MTTFDFSKLTTLNQTALLVALRRASESTRPDAMFHDALAETVATLLTDSPMTPEFWHAAKEMAELSGDAVALRTRHFDEQIESAVRSGVRQIVTLGAGLDGRSHRLNLNPNTRFFDIDEPVALDARNALLEGAGLTAKYPRQAISATIPDARLPEQLRSAGFHTGSSAVFVAEGLLYYLSSTDLEHMLVHVGSLAAPGSVFLADFPADRPLNTHDEANAPSVTAPFQTGPRADPWELFQSANWLLNCRTLKDLSATYGRALPHEIDEREGGARWWYAAARRP